MPRASKEDNVRTWYWLAAGLVAIAALLAACDGDSDSGDGGDRAATAPPATREATRDAGDGDDTETAAPTEPGDGADDGDGGDGDGGSGSGDLGEAIERFKASTFSATYTATDTDTENPLNGTVRIYKDGIGRFRFDVTGTFDGQESTFLVIETPDVSGFCLQGAGELTELFGVPEGEEGVCFGNDPTGGFGGLADELRNFNADGFELLDTSSRQVAGRDADCFRMRDVESDEIQEVCIDDEGALLYSKNEGPTTMTMEATDVSGSVSDSDFELPYELREIPGLGGE